MTSLTSAKEAADSPLTPETPGEYLNEKRSIPLQDVNALDYDCDSLSDGREKADTTPENLKKIDDVISEQRTALNTIRDDSSLRSHFWSHPSVVVGVDTTTINPITTTTISTNTTSGSTMMMINFNNNSEPVLRVDESERKLDMDKSSPHLRSSSYSSSTTNDSLGKRDHNESATNATPAAMVEGRNNGNNICSYKTAVSPNNNYDESSIDSTSTTATKQSFAFTIDNFNDKDCDPAAAQAKYKSMLERFQQRHRRGASMSKLENTSSSASGKETLKTSTSAAALMKSGVNAGAQDCDNTGGAESAASPTAAAAKVKLRPRDRSTSRVRDANKRHSWSPRSSTSELTPAPANNTTTATSNNKTSTSNHQQSRSTTQRQEAMPPQSVRKSNASAKQTKPQSAPMTKANNTSCVTPARQQFTPRSTAMQLALQKVDFMCAQPPLADFKHLHIEADNISETGTYTLDGDNYTEEQKDLMNIDKSTLERAQKARRAAQVAAALSRPTDLELRKATQVNTTAVAVAAAGGSRQNVLEVNYFHESEAPAPRTTAPNDFLLGSNQSASSYLEKIKSRVLRNMTVTKNCVQDLDVGKMMESSSSEKTPPSSADVGTFTSVTTSGVLAKQSALDARPKLTRRSSLSTSQIDSSEYVSNEVKLKQSGAAAYAAGGFTDHQKAEYRLNVFTNQKDTHTFSAPNRSFIQTPPDSPAVYKPEPPPPVLSDAAVLKTAQNKNDWIQEWARNARARSLASCDGSKNRQHLQTQELMTRSYTCSETGNESLTDDSVFNAQRPPTGFSNKTLASRYRLVSGEFDYASDPALSTSFTSKTTQSTTAEPTRPPKSPSKIPSPLHSLGRARSASRTRASLQNMLQLEAAEADSYLQKTAAAINNLQQSLSRKNSLQSPAHSGSPRAGRSNKSGGGAYYSPDEISPQHSLESPTAGGNYQPALMRNAHKRNLSMETYNRDARAQMQLMTSSFNEQQLQLLTGGGGDYVHHRQRGRKNSFDDNMQLVMPNSPVTHRTNWGGTQSARGLKIHEQQQISDPSSMSPLRRSSSFSAKVAGTRAARPQYQNIYTPPAARQNYVPASGGGGGGGGVYHQAPPHGIKKSASSNNFGNVYSDYDENLAYYIKDEDEYGDDDDDDDLGNDYYSSGEELEHEDYRYHHLEPHAAADASEGSNVPLTNTRLNKALLMRIERSKQKVAGGGGGGGVKNAPSSATSAKTVLGATIGGGGVVACPNTPELPRRNIKSAPRSNVARQSMPRDSSLNRLAGQIPNSLASAKKQLLQTAATAVPTKISASTARVQPKYLDISKYKPAQGNNFLRKNDAKSTLKPAVAEAMKRSPSSSSMGLSRGDVTRASNRSAKSATSVMTSSGTTLSGRASSAVRRDASVNKQKEAELAMWKRRAKYDPMKAAAEDRRKKEEAKRMAQTTNLTTNEEFINESTNQTHTFQRQTSCDNQWTLGLREAGNEELSD